MVINVLTLLEHTKEGAYAVKPTDAHLAGVITNARFGRLPTLDGLVAAEAGEICVFRQQIRRVKVQLTNTFMCRCCF